MTTLLLALDKVTVSYRTERGWLDAARDPSLTLRPQDASPYHPYTEALLSAIPVPDPDAVQQRIRLDGKVPSADHVPPGCRFHTRCPRKLGEVCKRDEPPWRQASASHRLCCHIELAELRRLQAPVVLAAATRPERAADA